MDAWIVERIFELAEVIWFMAAGTALVLFLLSRADKQSSWPRMERRKDPRK